MPSWWRSSKIECYFCSAPQSDERVHVAQRMMELWKGLPWANVNVLTPALIGCSDFHFQKMRRVAAESMAKNAVYILTDDDCEPLSDLSHVLTAMRQHEDYAILSALPVNASIHQWTPESYQAHQDAMVFEHHNVGGLRMIRKGAITTWPEQERRSYDAEHCQALRDNGYRVGYSKFWRMRHAGEGASDLWRNSDLTSVSQ